MNCCKNVGGGGQCLPRINLFLFCALTYIWTEWTDLFLTKCLPKILQKIGINIHKIRLNQIFAGYLKHIRGLQFYRNSFKLSCTAREKSARIKESTAVLAYQCRSLSLCMHVKNLSCFEFLELIHIVRLNIKIITHPHDLLFFLPHKCFRWFNHLDNKNTLSSGSQKQSFSVWETLIRLVCDEFQKYVREDKRLKINKHQSNSILQCFRFL